jgi:integrase
MASTWSTFVEAHGIRIRLYQRRRGGSIYREIRLADGSKDRKSMRTSDREYAKDTARKLAAKIAAQRLTGATPGTLTLAQLHGVYQRERGPLLSERRKVELRRAFTLLREHLGDGFRVSDLGPHQVDTYAAARMGGALAATGGHHGGGKVRATTVARELGVLKAALNWAEHYRRSGRPLVDRNPLRGVPMPSEPNPARPVATRERFGKLRAVADGIDDTGAFRTMLDLAWYTGRRFGSIAALRASDILLTPEQVARALADAGREEYLAEAWPAAIRWAAEADKTGTEWIVPIPDVLRDALTRYLRERGLLGGALLFPSRTDSAEPMPKGTAYYWLREAEKRAVLPHQRQGGWHAFRRAWATARKGMPLQDVMAAGGWKDPAALQTAYQHADAATIRRVMEAD